VAKSLRGYRRRTGGDGHCSECGNDKFSIHAVLLDEDGLPSVGCWLRLVEPGEFQTGSQPLWNARKIGHALAIQMRSVSTCSEAGLFLSGLTKPEGRGGREPSLCRAGDQASQELPGEECQRGGGTE
jgi:hypothetical protein